jgi:general secretion pathway protein A
MYESFYRLKKAPFHITPDPEFLFLGPTHKEALASIVYGVEKRKGFIVIVGEVGLGKTTILRSYLERVDKQHLKIIYVFNPNVPFAALLETIHQELGLDARPGDVAAMVNRLHQALIEEYRQGRNVVLVVDEAQNMPVETLESLRMLSNLETSTDKLIQIALVGPPELEALLDRHELRQLKQRIAVRSTLAPLSATESLAYIRYRLEKAGAMSTDIFTRGALRRIVKHARGIPRLLNILCDNALITGLGYQKKPVTAAIVREVIADFQGKRGSQLWKWEVAALAVLVGIGGLLVVTPQILQPQPRLENSPPRAVPPQLAPVSAASESSAVPPSLPSPPGSPSPPDTHGSPKTAQAAASQAQRVPAAAKPPAKGTWTVVATRVVKPGDNLYRLAAEVYGSSGKKVLDAILRSNPGLKNPNVLLIGTRIQFPEVAEKRAAANGKAEDQP